jgi:hypothetical protein
MGQCFGTSGPDRSRTCDLLRRRQALYPAELRTRSRCGGNSTATAHPEQPPLSGPPRYLVHPLGFSFTLAESNWPGGAQTRASTIVMTTMDAGDCHHGSGAHPRAPAIARLITIIASTMTAVLRIWCWRRFVGFPFQDAS